MPSIYVAGPMTGYPKFNFDAFFEASEAFQEGGWTVYNPAAHDLETFGSLEKCERLFNEDPVGQLRQCLAWDLQMITERCEAIAMLPGWERSFGARAEHATAVALRLQIIYLDT